MHVDCRVQSRIDRAEGDRASGAVRIHWRCNVQRPVPGALGQWSRAMRSSGQHTAVPGAVSAGLPCPTPNEGADTSPSHGSGARVVQWVRESGTPYERGVRVPGSFTDDLFTFAKISLSTLAVSQTFVQRVSPSRSRLASRVGWRLSGTGSNEVKPYEAQRFATVQ